MMNKLSIIMIAQGDEADLEHALNSIWKQSYKDYELLLYVKEIPGFLDSVTKDNFYINSIKGKLSKSLLRKQAVEDAKGEYILFFEPFDFLLEDTALATRISELESLNIDCYFDAVIELIDGLYYFYHPTNDDKCRITEQNFILYAHRRVGFNLLTGKYIKKSLLDRLSLSQWDKEDAEILFDLIKISKNSMYVNNCQYIFRKLPNRSVKKATFSNRFLVSDCSKFVEENKKMTADYPNDIHIAICVDRFVADELGPLLYSIGSNNTDNVFVYLIYYDLDSKKLERYLILNDYFDNLTIQLLPIPNYLHAALEKISMDKVHLPISSFYRILIPELILHTDRVLYLDADVLVNQSLSTLWHTDLEGCYLGVVSDLGVAADKFDPDAWGYQLLGDDGAKYFNSGVLLMDLGLIRKRNLLFDFYQFCIYSTDLTLLGDQDAFNLFYFNAVKYLNISNNFVIYMFKHYPIDIDEITILHFLGPNKPWKVNEYGTGQSSQAYKVYRKYNQYFTDLENQQR